MLKIEKNEKNRNNRPKCWECGFLEFINQKTMGMHFLLNSHAPAVPRLSQGGVPSKLGGAVGENKYS